MAKKAATTKRLTTGNAHTGDFMEVGQEVVPGMRLRCICRGHRGTIGRIAWSPCGRFIASPSEDKTIRIWDANDGECLAVLETGDVMRAASWSPDSKHIACLGTRGLLLCDTASALAGDTVVPIALSDSGFGFSVAWSPDGKTIATSYEGQQAALWDVNSRTQPLILGKKESNDADVHVAWSLDLKQAYSFCLKSQISRRSGPRAALSAAGNLVSIIRHRH